MKKKKKCKWNDKPSGEARFAVVEQFEFVVYFSIERQSA